MKKVLITGSCGFIGSALCQQLFRRNYEVYAFDNLMYNQWHLVHRLNEKDNIYFTKADCVDLPKSVIQAVDIIIPLAAIVGAKACDKYPEQSQAINVDQISNILRYIKPEQKLILLNSNSGLGTVEGIADENTPRNAVSLYGRQKDEFENIGRKHSNSVAFRLATLFGTSYRTRVDLLVNSLVGEAVFNNEIKVFDPQFKRNFIHVNDVVRAILFSLDNWDLMRGEVYNLGNDSCNMTKGELADKIACKFKSKLPVIIGDGQDEDRRDYMVSSAKLYNLYYKPLFDLDYGITEMMNFYQNLPKDTYLRNQILSFNRNY